VISVNGIGYLTQMESAPTEMLSSAIYRCDSDSDVINVRAHNADVMCDVIST